MNKCIVDHSIPVDQVGADEIKENQDDINKIHADELFLLWTCFRFREILMDKIVGKEV